MDWNKVIESLEKYAETGESYYDRAKTREEYYTYYSYYSRWNFCGFKKRNKK